MSYKQQTFFVGRKTKELEQTLGSLLSTNQALVRHVQQIPI